MQDNVLAKDKIGECRYTITVEGKNLVCTMRGYGLKATEVEPLKPRRNDHFAFDAAALRDKMVRLEQRMRSLARLTEQLKANKISGVPTLKKTRQARGVNPVAALMEKL